MRGVRCGGAEGAEVLLVVSRHSGGDRISDPARGSRWPVEAGSFRPGADPSAPQPELDRHAGQEEEPIAAAEGQLLGDPEAVGEDLIRAAADDQR